MARTSGSGIYRPAPERPQRPSIYVDNPYSGLESYSREKADPLAKRPDESEENWLRRTAVYRPAAELEALAEAEKQAWDEHRALADRRVGSGTGLYGNETPQSRAAVLGHRGFAERAVEAGRGNLAGRVESLAANRPASAADINAILKEREAERMGQQPVRQTIPAGSSGEGIFIQ
jgi:hypothetical protein